MFDGMNPWLLVCLLLAGWVVVTSLFVLVWCALISLGGREDK